MTEPRMPYLVIKTEVVRPILPPACTGIHVAIPRCAQHLLKGGRHGIPVRNRTGESHEIGAPVTNVGRLEEAILCDLFVHALDHVVDVFPGPERVAVPADGREAGADYGGQAGFSALVVCSPPVPEAVVSKGLEFKSLRHFIIVIMGSKDVTWVYLPWRAWLGRRSQTQGHDW